MIGRFFLGLSMGGYCVSCPKFVNEISPVELRGPIGAMSQIICTFGIFLPSAFAMFFDYEQQDPGFTFIRLIWGFPIIFCVAQIILMLTLFREDSPTELKTKGEMARL
jgi:MFS family permease